MFASLICSCCTSLISVLLHVFIVFVRYSCIFFSFFDAQIFFLFIPVSAIFTAVFTVFCFPHCLHSFFHRTKAFQQFRRGIKALCS